MLKWELFEILLGRRNLWYIINFYKKRNNVVISLKIKLAGYAEVSEKNFIEEFKGEISDLFSPDQRFTFLVGAGISMDPPSNMPSAIEIVRTLVEIYGPPEETENLMQLDNLRYELIVELFQFLFDKNLKFLDYLDLIQNPNLIHLFLANTIINNSFVVTTNFDYLIEFGLMRVLDKKNHSKIIPVITKSDYQKFQNPYSLNSEGFYSVYKIHGSKRNLISDTNTEESLITTLTSLGKGKEEGETFAIETFKKPSIFNLMNDRVLIIMGYSGSDDFDIGPTIEELPFLNRIIWIDHTMEEGTQIHEIKKLDTSDVAANKLDIAANNDISSKTIKKLVQIRSKYDFRVFYIKSNTGNFVENTLWGNLLPKVELNKKLLEKKAKEPPSFKKWFESQISKIPTFKKYNFAAELFYRLKNLEGSLRTAKIGLDIAEKKGKKTDMLKFLNILGSIYDSAGDYEKALQSYTDSLDLSEKIKDIPMRIKILSNIGTIYSHYQKYDNALEIFNSALKLSYDLKINKDKSAIHNNLGTTHQNLGNLDKATENYEIALKIAENDGDLFAKITYLNNIGSIFHKRENYSGSMEKINEARLIAEQLGDPELIAVTYDSMGHNYLKMNDNENALEYFNKSLKLYDEMGNLHLKTSIQHHIGFYYSEMGDFDNASKMFKKAINTADKCGDIIQKSYLLGETGMIYMKLQKFKEALAVMEESKKLAKESGLVQENQMIGMVISQLKNIINKKPKEEAKEETKEEIKGEIKEETKESDLDSILQGYIKDGNIDAGFEEIRKAGKIILETKDLAVKATGMAAAGNFYFGIKYYDEAIGMYKPILNFHEQSGNLIEQAGILIKMGKISEAQGKAKEALERYNFSLRIFNQLGLVDESAEMTKTTSEIMEKLPKEEVKKHLTKEGAYYEKMGDELTTKQNYQNAMMCYKKASDHYNFVLEMGKVVGILVKSANIARITGNNVDALVFLEMGIKIYEGMGDKLGMGNQRTEIALYFYYTGDYENALHQNELALKIANKIKNNPLKLDCLLNKSTFYTAQKKYKEAHKINSDLLSLARKTGNQTRENDAYYAEGCLYQSEGKDKSAIKEFNNSMNLCKKHEMQRELALTLYFLGESYKNTGDFKKTLSVFEESLQHFENINDSVNSEAMKVKIDEVKEKIGK